MDPRLVLFNPYLQEAYNIYEDDPRLHLFMINEIVDRGEFESMRSDTEPNWRTAYNPSYFGKRGFDYNNQTRSPTNDSVSRSTAQQVANQVANQRHNNNNNSIFDPQSDSRARSASSGRHPIRSVMTGYRPGSKEQIMAWNQK